MTLEHHPLNSTPWPPDDATLHASELLRRPPPTDYRAETSALLICPEEKQKIERNELILVFGLAAEWLAIPLQACKEVLQSRLVHRIPHQRTPLIRGVCNVNGELQICFDLAVLLETPTASENATVANAPNQKRLIAIAKDNDFWVFAVDVVDGIHSFERSILESLPENLANTHANYLLGTILINDKKVGLLDVEGIFSRLRIRTL